MALLKSYDLVLSQINNWLDNLASRNRFVESINIGKTYEGRKQKLLRITEAGIGKPNVYIQAGIHARFSQYNYTNLSFHEKSNMPAGIAWAVFYHLFKLFNHNSIADYLQF